MAQMAAQLAQVTAQMAAAKQTLLDEAATLDNDIQTLVNKRDITGVVIAALGKSKTSFVMLHSLI